MIGHPGWQDTRYETTAVSDDPDQQVEEVIGLMRGYTEADYRTPQVSAQAAQAIAYGGGADPVQAVFNHVKGQMSFVRDEVIAMPMQPNHDVPIVEVLVRPVDMATMCAGGQCRRMGDCDDYSMYAAALLMNLGVDVSFVTLAADPADPARYSHVYVAAYPEGRGGPRVALDVSHGKYAGWEAADQFGKKREWPVGGGGWMKWLAGGGLVWAAARMGGLA